MARHHHQSSREYYPRVGRRTVLGRLCEDSIILSVTRCVKGALDTFVLVGAPTEPNNTVWCSRESALLIDCHFPSCRTRPPGCGAAYKPFLVSTKFAVHIPSLTTSLPSTRSRAIIACFLSTHLASALLLVQSFLDLYLNRRRLLQTTLLMWVLRRDPATPAC